MSIDFSKPRGFTASAPDPTSSAPTPIIIDGPAGSHRQLKLTFGNNQTTGSITDDNSNVVDGLNFTGDNATIIADQTGMGAPSVISHDNDFATLKERIDALQPNQKTALVAKLMDGAAGHDALQQLVESGTLPTLPNTVSGASPAPTTSSTTSDDLLRKILGDDYGNFSTKDAASVILDRIAPDKRTKLLNDLGNLEDLSGAYGTIKYHRGVDQLTTALITAAKDSALSPEEKNNFLLALGELNKETAQTGTHKFGPKSAIDDALKQITTTASPPIPPTPPAPPTPPTPPTTPTATSGDLTAKIAGYTFGPADAVNAAKAFNDMTPDEIGKAMQALGDYKGMTDPDVDGPASKKDADTLTVDLKNIYDGIGSDKGKKAFLDGLTVIANAPAENSFSGQTQKAVTDAIRNIKGEVPSPGPNQPPAQPPVSPPTSPPPTSTAADDPMAPSDQTGFDAKRTEKRADGSSGPVELDFKGRKEVHFGWDSSGLDTQNHQQVLANAPQLKQWIKEHPGQQIILIGHCDPSGSYEYNDALGLRRANAVKDILVKEGGIDAKDIQVLTDGKRNPEDHANPDSGVRSQIDRSVTFNAGPKLVALNQNYAPSNPSTQSPTAPPPSAPSTTITTTGNNWDPLAYAPSGQAMTNAVNQAYGYGQGVYYNYGVPAYNYAAPVVIGGANRANGWFVDLFNGHDHHHEMGPQHAMGRGHYDLNHGAPGGAPPVQQHQMMLHGGGRGPGHPG